MVLMDRAMVRGIFEAFDHGNVNYCALRHWEEFLAAEDTHLEEIDLLVCGSDLPRIDQVMSASGARRISRRLAPPWVRYQLPPNAGGAWIDFDVDGPTCLGVTYLPADGILARKVRRDIFYIPSPEDAWVDGFLRSILSRRVGRPDVRRRLAGFNAFEEGKRRIIRDHLAIGVTTPLADYLITLVERGAWDALAASRSRLFRHLVLRDSRNLAGYLRGKASQWKKRLFSSRPRGVLVAVIGLDGSGKTTFASALAERLRDSSVPGVIVYLGMGRDRIIPGLQQVGAAVGVGPGSKNSASRAGGLRSKVFLAVRDALSLLDFAFRYFARVFPRLRRGECVVTDRYFYDLLERPDVQGWTKWLLLRAYPMPDLTVLLAPDASVLHERRPGWKPEELERRQETLNGLAAGLRERGRAEVLTLPSEDVAKSVDVVLRTMEERGLLAAVGF